MVALLEGYPIEIVAAIIGMGTRGLIDLLYCPPKPLETPVAKLVPDIEPHRPPPHELIACDPARYFWTSYTVYHLV
jgi:hypothetical protein